MSILLVFVFSIIGAAMFRLRGSVLWYEWTGRGATTVRILWASVLAAMALALGLHWTYSLALVFAFWLGAILPWWKSLDMTSREDFLLHTLRGTIWTLPAAIVMAFAGIMGSAIPLIVVGALCGVIYNECYRAKVRHPTELAEWIFGGCIAGALLLGIVLA